MQAELDLVGRDADLVTLVHAHGAGDVAQPGKIAMRVSTSRAAFVSLWLVMGIVGGGPAAARGDADGAAEIRLLCFGPSPYTSRHDSMRAGFGIYLLLQQVIRDENLPLRATIYDAFPSVENADKARALLRDARVLVVGTSTL